MSGARLLAVRRACSDFERNRDLLLHAIDQREPRQCLDAFAELCAVYLAQTGGTLVTESYRAQLAVLRARVELVPVLTLLPTPKESPEMIEIEVAMPCLAPGCTGHGYVTLACHGTYQCTCAVCYDPTEDGAHLCKLSGTGSTPEQAVAAWVDAVQEAAGVEFWHDDARLAFELRRQAGWVQTVTQQGIWYAPELLAAE